MDNCSTTRQRHVHEFQGSVELAELNTNNVHNHRFAGVTGEEIPCKCSHIHRIVARTDYYNNHFHIIDVKTGPAIPVGNGERHVHYVYATTRTSDGHTHTFRVVTLIENPIGGRRDCCCDITNNCNCDSGRDYSPSNSNL